MREGTIDCEGRLAGTGHCLDMAGTVGGQSSSETDPIGAGQSTSKRPDNGPGVITLETLKKSLSEEQRYKVVVHHTMMSKRIGSLAVIKQLCSVAKLKGDIFKYIYRFSAIEVQESRRSVYKLIIYCKTEAFADDMAGVGNLHMGGHEMKVDRSCPLGNLVSGAKTLVFQGLYLESIPDAIQMVKDMGLVEIESDADVSIGASNVVTVRVAKFLLPIPRELKMTCGSCVIRVQLKGNGYSREEISGFDSHREDGEISDKVDWSTLGREGGQGTWGMAKPVPKQCGFCDKFGHIKKDCPDFVAYKKKREEMECGNCYGKGHMGWQCTNASVCRRCKEPGHFSWDRASCSTAIDEDAQRASNKNRKDADYRMRQENAGMSLGEYEAQKPRVQTDALPQRGGGDWQTNLSSADVAKAAEVNMVTDDQISGDEGGSITVVEEDTVVGVDGTENTGTGESELKKGDATPGDSGGGIPNEVKTGDDVVNSSGVTMSGDLVGSSQIRETLEKNLLSVISTLTDDDVSGVQTVGDFVENDSQVLCSEIDDLLEKTKNVVTVGNSEVATDAYAKLKKFRSEYGKIRIKGSTVSLSSNEQLRKNVLKRSLGQYLGKTRECENQEKKRRSERLKKSQT